MTTPGCAPTEDAWSPLGPILASMPALAIGPSESMYELTSAAKAEVRRPSTVRAKVSIFEVYTRSRTRLGGLEEFHSMGHCVGLKDALVGNSYVIEVLTSSREVWGSEQCPYGCSAEPAIKARCAKGFSNKLHFAELPALKATHANGSSG
jgi:hypothetical protein